MAQAVILQHIQTPAGVGLHFWEVLQGNKMSGRTLTAIQEEL